MDINQLKLALIEQIVNSNNIELLQSINGILNEVQRQESSIDKTQIGNLIDSLSPRDLDSEAQELQQSIDDIFNI